MKEGEFTFVKIQNYVSEVLFGNRDLIAFYDRSSGLSFCTDGMEQEFVSSLGRYSNGENSINLRS